MSIPRRSAPLLAALLVLLFAGPLLAQAPTTPPTAGGSGPQDVPPFTIALSDAPITTALAAVSRTAGVQIVRKGRIPDAEKVSVIAQLDPLPVVLDKIIGARDWVWRYNEASGIYEIWDRITYEQQVLSTMMIEKTFQLRYIKAEDIQQALQPLINTDKGASLALDARTNKIFVRDLPEVVQEVARLIDELDVNLVTRVFRIRHANVEELADKLAVYKSEPGTIDIDVRTRQVVVSDIEQNIRRMELLVEVLDVGPEIRVYNLNTIGFEGKDLDALQTAVEAIITAGALFEISYQAGTMVLEDVEEVHEKVEMLLAALDPVPKQVLIECEIIETNFIRTLEYGIEYQLSEDLFGAANDGLFGETIPRGSVTEDPVNPLGFINFRNEFPILSLVDGALNVVNLSSKARIVLSAALRDTDTQILLQPRLWVKNHETASIEVGGEEPISNPVFNDQGQLISTTRSSVREGLYLELRPTISNNGFVEIEVLFENNDAEQAGVDGLGNPLVRRSTQQIETVLLIPSGETRVIGGLLVNSNSDIDRGIPFLSDIPWIGPLLFGSKSSTGAQRHIMVFLTATIVEDVPSGDAQNRRPMYHQGLRDQLTGDGGTRRGSDGRRGRTPAELTRERQGADAGAPAAGDGVDGAPALDGLEGAPSDAEALIEGATARREHLGLEVMEDGRPIEFRDGADAGDNLGDKAPDLFRRGRLADDPAVHDTLADPVVDAEAGAEIGSYQVRVGAVGNTGGGGRAPARGAPDPGRPIAPTAAGRMEPGQQPGQQPGAAQPPINVQVRVPTPGGQPPAGQPTQPGSIPAGVHIPGVTTNETPYG